MSNCEYDIEYKEKNFDLDFEHPTFELDPLIGNQESFEIDFGCGETFELNFPSSKTFNLDVGSTFELAFPEPKVFELDLCGVTNVVGITDTGLFMTKAVYDPQTIEGDAFLLDNHTGNLETNNIIIDGGLLG